MWNKCHGFYFQYNLLWVLYMIFIIFMRYYFHVFLTKQETSYAAKDALLIPSLNYTIDHPH